MLSVYSGSFSVSQRCLKAQDFKYTEVVGLKVQAHICSDNAGMVSEKRDKLL